ncbi:MAG: hypothetical protein KA896_08320 [Leptothrix sp. (in: Bacteria)]|nr:hypothetical protein [Leptothrix sp. (in: b-proteobacteria)]
MRMPMTRRAALPFLGALGLALTGCGGGGGGDDGDKSFAAKAMVDNLADNIITATYDALNTAALTLVAVVTNLKNSPTEDNLNAAQDAWRATRVPWESSEGFIFGPVDVLAIDPAIDSWPLNTADLAAFLVATPNATQTDIENAGDDLRGFHAMEYLLFGDGVNDNDKAATELTAAELNYLIALAQAFQAKTQALYAAWATSFNGGAAYATTLKTPGASNSEYTAYGAVVQQLINAVAGIADEVGNAKMAEPLGSSLAEADTSKVESQYSWNSLTDFHNNLQSVLNVYTGKRGFSWQADTVSASLNGLYAFVAFHDGTLATRVLTEITNAQKAIALIKGDGNNTSTVISGSAKPFRTQITDSTGRALITTAIAACNTLLTTLRSNVLPLVAKTTFSA